MPFSVDPDIAKAKTIGTYFYLNRHVYKNPKEKILARTWQFIGDTYQVKEPAWVTPVQFLEN
jgi:choline monooxygenase